MIPPTEFRARAELCREAGGLVPVWRDCLLDLCTPVSAFAKLRRGPFAFLLESAVTRGQAWSRYTYLGTEPRAAWRLKDGVVEDWTAESGWHGARTPADPIGDLRDLVRDMNPVDAPELDTLWSGAFGFFSYDTVRHIERLPNSPPRVLNYPDACFVFTDTLVVIDNWRGQARVIASVPVPAGADDETLTALYTRADAKLEETIARLQGPEVLPPLQLHHDATPAVARSTYERDAFLHDVARIKEYILSGDVFQALLARRMEVPLDFDPTTLYRTLRALNPSPYMFHLQLDGFELVGSSPEMMLRVAEGKVTLRPIAGTRPRGRTEAEDQALADELINDEKERAEHVMLVDLGRNDVGRLAKYGSVEVTDLMIIEKYSHVFHIVSQVEGRLPQGASALDAFRAVFPAGTMTGAPKVRAMEIIDELEPERRGAYAGALGVIGAGDTRMDLAITIRTCVIADGVASVQAGAGIVHDSVPDKEWEETENKARAMLTAIGRARAARRNADAGQVWPVEPDGR
ncbi:anthranilate synthase component I [Gemmatimonas sp.]|uniref:anthranilate synthase component I n=1 Tax=Gemmatimonas sp. TaxID=1962908 RepID=UPI0027B95126|nr:anthranilate synthase component I [Gemmatimonas sp.]